MTVYLDLYFLENLVMDYLLLSAVLPPSVKRLRRMLAASFGAVCACLAAICQLPSELQPFISLPVAGLMLLLAQPPVSPSYFFKRFLFLFTCSFFFAGLLPFLLSYLRLWLLCVALAYLMLHWFLRFMDRRSKNLLLEITCGDSSWQLRAIVDSGNTLTEPISGLPVIVVRQGCLSHSPPGVFLVPFHTVGSHGLLLAFRPDQLRIDGQPAPPALIAPAPSFVGSPACQALVPLSLLS